MHIMENIHELFNRKKKQNKRQPNFQPSAGKTGIWKLAAENDAHKITVFNCGKTFLSWDEALNFAIMILYFQHLIKVFSVLLYGYCITVYLPVSYKF